MEKILKKNTQKNTKKKKTLFFYVIELNYLQFITYLLLILSGKDCL